MDADNLETGSDVNIMERMKSARVSEPTRLTEEAEKPEEEAPQKEEAAEEVEEVVEEVAAETESEEVVEAVESEAPDEDFSGTIDTVKYEYDEKSDTYSFKSNGKNIKASADKLIERFSQAENYTQDKMALSEERKSDQEQNTTDRAAIAEARSKLSDLSTELEALINIEANTDLSELEEEDPYEFIKQTKALDSRKQTLSKAKAELQTAQQEQYDARVQSETAALTKALPQWEDQEVMKKDMISLNKCFASYNVTPEDIAQLLDHRIYLMALDAAKYQEMQTVSARVKKQVKKAPKSVKPGLKALAKEDQKMIDAIAKLKQSGNDLDAVALLRARRNNR